VISSVPVDAEDADEPVCVNDRPLVPVAGLLVLSTYQLFTRVIISFRLGISISKPCLHVHGGSYYVRGVGLLIRFNAANSTTNDDPNGQYSRNGQYYPPLIGSQGFYFVIVDCFLSANGCT
jgi:hypothetical protein